MPQYSDHALISYWVLLLCVCVCVCVCVSLPVQMKSLVELAIDGNPVVAAHLDTYRQTLVNKLRTLKHLVRCLCGAGVSPAVCV